jgi:hypothetical protein
MADVVIGVRYWHWIVESRSDARRRRSTLWNCVCAKCGKQRQITADFLRRQMNRSVAISCGHPGQHGIADGLRTAQKRRRRCRKSSTEYNSWQAMTHRCNKPKNKDYPKYGAVGIRVCDRWMVFKNFLADMGLKPTPNHSIDRYPNQRGNYEPGNCRWATKQQQARNCKRNVMVDVYGERMCVSEAAERYGVPGAVIYKRLRLGWSGSDAVTVPAIQPKITPPAGKPMGS